MVKFKQLSEQRQLEIAHESVDAIDWTEHVIGVYKTLLALNGFDDADIEFQGFWSQGDGASFTCSSVDFEKFWNENWKEFTFTFTGGEIDYEPEIAEAVDMFDILPPFFIKNLVKEGFFNGKITRASNHYVHSKTIALELHMESYSVVDEGDDPDFDCREFTKEEEDELNAFEIYLEVFVDKYIENISNTIYKALEKEYNDYIKGTLETYKKQNDLW